MDYADYNQLNEVFTQTLWMVCKAGALIFGGLSLGSLVMCVGGLVWQCLVDAQDALRRRTPRRELNVARIKLIQPFQSGSPELCAATPCTK